MYIKNYYVTNEARADFINNCRFSWKKIRLSVDKPKWFNMLIRKIRKGANLGKTIFKDENLEVKQYHNLQIQICGKEIIAVIKTDLEDYFYEVSKETKLEYDEHEKNVNAWRRKKKNRNEKLKEVAINV